MDIQIKDFPNYYINKNGCVINKKSNKILKPHIDSNGYPRITLNRKKFKINFRIHRLLAEYFIPNPENKPEVNHIDGNKKNNDLQNLEWCTRKENIHHAISIGLSIPTNSRARPIFQFDLDGSFIREWKSVRFAARELNLHDSLICATALGRQNRKQSGGFQWRYKL